MYMHMLIFDIGGKFAHYRKYDTNSSSLSYSAPPRTAISGLIAGIMGMERDSYYPFFVPERARIGVRILTKNRRVMQTLNYLKLEGVKDFRFPKSHTQIPFELLTNSQLVKYRIYFWHEEEAFMKELEERLENRRFYYAPYMGAAPFQCQIQRIGYEKAIQVDSENPIPVSSVVRVEEVEENSVEFYGKRVRLSRERMPRFFQEDRYLEQAAAYLMEIDGNPLTMKVTGETVRVEYTDGQEFITFL